MSPDGTLPRLAGCFRGPGCGPPPGCDSDDPGLCVHAATVRPAGHTPQGGERHPLPLLHPDSAQGHPGRLCAVSWLTEPPSEDVVRSGSMPDPPRPSASSGRKRTWMGLSEEGGLLRMLKSQGAVRDSLISGHGQTQPHPPLTPLLCSGSMQGQRLLGTSPLILIKHKKKTSTDVSSQVPDSQRAG